MAAMLPAPDKALPHGPDRDADRALSFRWPQDPAPSRIMIRVSRVQVRVSAAQAGIRLGV
eukprot:3337098-Rhodomonas_salina.1